MPFPDCNQKFGVLEPTATGRDRVLSSGTDAVLEVVRVAANEKFPALLPALYPDSKKTDPRPYVSLDAMWRALVTNKTPAVNGETFFLLPVSSTGARSSAPSGPWPADHGRGQGRVPFKSLLWQTGSSHHSLVMPIDDSFDPWLDHTSNCWPLEEHHHAEVVAVKASFETDDPPRWSDLLSPRAGSLPENRGLCLNCHENNHSFKHCRHPFITASDCLNPELGQLRDNNAHRR